MGGVNTLTNSTMHTTTPFPVRIGKEYYGGTNSCNYNIPTDSVQGTVSRNKQVLTILISLKSRSKTFPYFLLGVLKSIPYHDLQNAIGDIQLVTLHIIKNIIKDTSIIPAKRANSHVNFRVTGSARKHKHMNIIANPRLGHICIIPDNSVVSLVPNLF